MRTQWISCQISLAKFVTAFALLLPAPGQAEGNLVPLPNAHAHNDYHQPRPLLDALERGFCSVEADIFLVNGQLLVGHDRDELDEERTLQSLYLDPLQQRVKQNGGRIYPQAPTLTLLIDIKSDGSQTYTVLREVLATYQDMISAVIAGQYQERAIEIVISGDRPLADIAGDTSRHVGIDGRLTDLDSRDPAHLMPLISDNWGSHFSWRGTGEFPAAEREKLRTIVARAHAAGRRVRFWATPENPVLWRALLAAGVDHIGTDELDLLRDFLAKESLPNP